MKTLGWITICLLLGCSPAPPPTDPVLNTEGVVRVIQQANKPLILNLWATWCEPCVEELPALQKLRESHPPGNLSILALSYDAMIPEETPQSAQATVQSFLASQGYTFETVIFWDDDYADLNQTLDLPGPIPVTLAFNAKGEELGRIEGKASPSDLAELVGLITDLP